MIILFDTDIGLGTPRAELDDGAAIVFLLRARDYCDREAVGAGSGID